MDPQFLSTGQAAKVCSVTPDTILKWIRAGRLPARRTAGGHHRIDRRDLDRLVEKSPEASRLSRLRAKPRHFRYCWEHKAKGGMIDGCKDCMVYQLRAQRCYDVAKLAPDMGHSHLFCQTSCDQCDYYQHVVGQGTNLLVVTDDEELAEGLRQQVDGSGLNVEIVDCEYTCSSVVEVFRPDFAVVDSSLGSERAADITYRLSQDPRIPFVRVILAGSTNAFPEKCDRQVFARIDKPFDLRDVAACAALPQVSTA